MSDRGISLPTLYCAQCGDCLLDQNHWSDERTIVVRCYRCGNEGQISGFVIGRVHGSLAQRAQGHSDCGLFMDLKEMPALPPPFGKRMPVLPGSTVEVLDAGEFDELSDGANDD